MHQLIMHFIHKMKVDVIPRKQCKKQESPVRTQFSLMPGVNCLPGKYIAQTNDQEKEQEGQ